MPAVKGYFDTVSAEQAKYLACIGIGFCFARRLMVSVIFPEN